MTTSGRSPSILALTAACVGDVELGVAVADHLVPGVAGGEHHVAAQHPGGAGDEELHSAVDICVSIFKRRTGYSLHKPASGTAEMRSPIGIVSGPRCEEESEAKAFAELVAKLGEPGDVAQARRRRGLHLDSDHIAARVLDHQIDLVAAPIAVVVERKQRTEIADARLADYLVHDESLEGASGDSPVRLQALSVDPQQGAEHARVGKVELGGANDAVAEVGVPGRQPHRPRRAAPRPAHDWRRSCGRYQAPVQSRRGWSMRRSVPRSGARRARLHPYP